MEMLKLCEYILRFYAVMHTAVKATVVDSNQSGYTRGQFWWEIHKGLLTSVLTLHTVYSQSVC